MSPAVHSPVIYLVGAMLSTSVAFMWTKERPFLYGDLISRWFLGVVTGWFLAVAVFLWGGVV